MKKQTNQNNNSVGNTYLSKRFRMKMKQNTKIFIVTLLLQLLGIPAAMICGSMVSGHYISDFATVNSYEYLYKLSLYILAAAVLSGVFTAVKTFSYLHSRSDTDITLSLPLSRKQLFLADYLSGFLTYIIPYIIVLFLTMPAWFFSLDSKEHIFRNSETANLLNLRISSHFTHLFGFVFKIELFILLAMIFIYTFSVLIAICCGTLTDTIIYLILSNATAGICLYSFRNMISRSIVNTVPEFNNSTYEFERLTPAGAVHFIYRYMSNENENYHVDSGDLNWAVWCAVMCIICFTAAYFVFRHRKAEDTGKTVTFPFLFPVTAVLSVGAVFYTVCNFGSFYNIPNKIYSVENAVLMLVAVVFSFAVCSILFSLKERKLKLILSPKEMILPAVSAASAIVLYLAVLNTNAFGSLYRVPDADDVAKVYLHTPVDDIKHFPDRGIVITDLYTDAESIKQICDLNTMLNEDLRLSVEDNYALSDNCKANYPDLPAFHSEMDIPNQPIYAGGDDTFEITYCMKNGKVYIKTLIPFVTDYTTSEIIKSGINKLTEKMEHTHQVVVDSLDEKKFRVCFGSTDFTEKLYGHRFHSYVACTDQYPREYVATEFDRDLLKKILYASYYPVYYSTEDCYVFYIDQYNENTDEYSQGNLKFFLPAEYSDLYERFTESSNARKVEWYTYDGNGNLIIVND